MHIRGSLPPSAAYAFLHMHLVMNGRIDRASDWYNDWQDWSTATQTHTRFGHPSSVCVWFSVSLSSRIWKCENCATWRKAARTSSSANTLALSLCCIYFVIWVRVNGQGDHTQNTHTQQHQRTLAHPTIANRRPQTVNSLHSLLHHHVVSGPDYIHFCDFASSGCHFASRTIQPHRHWVEAYEATNRA